MKLHELSPAAGSVKAGYRKGRGPEAATERQPARDIRVRTHAPAAVFVSALKADSSLSIESFLREALRTDLQLTMQS